MKTKIITVSSCIVICIGMAISCSNNRTLKNTQLELTTSEKFINTLTHEDTLQVIALTNMCMDTLKAGKINQALKLIYYVKDTLLLPLPLDKEQRLYNKFKRFPILNYKLDSYSFETPKNNTVKYQIEFTHKTNNNTPNTINFNFCPIKIDSAWYLSVKN